MSLGLFTNSTDAAVFILTLGFGGLALTWFFKTFEGVCYETYMEELKYQKQIDDIAASRGDDFAFARYAAYANYISKMREQFRKEHSVLPPVIMDILCSFCEPTELEHFELVIATNEVYAMLLQHEIKITIGPQLLSVLFPWSTNRIQSCMEEFDRDGLRNKLGWNISDLVGDVFEEQWMDDCVLNNKVDELSAMFYKRYIRSAKALLRRGL